MAAVVNQGIFCFRQNSRKLAQLLHTKNIILRFDVCSLSDSIPVRCRLFSPSASNKFDRNLFTCNVLPQFVYRCPVVAVMKADHHGYGYECLTHQDCWKCGHSIDAEKEQYFCVCGVVQPPVEKRSFFQVMGVKETFDVDIRELSERFRNLQRILHPDKYSQKSETEIAFSIQHSSLVNKAYETLLKPLSRGLYMLRLQEENLENEIQMDPEFLDKIMELNELVIEADSLDAIKTIEIENQRTIDNLVANISVSFKQCDKRQAKEFLLKLKYYSNINDKIKGFIRSYSD